MRVVVFSCLALACLFQHQALALLRYLTRSHHDEIGAEGTTDIAIAFSLFSFKNSVISLGCAFGKPVEGPASLPESYA